MRLTASFVDALTTSHSLKHCEWMSSLRASYRKVVCAEKWHLSASINHKRFDAERVKIDTVHGIGVAHTGDWSCEAPKCENLL